MREIKLSCGPWQTGVFPELGANLAYLTYNGEHILRTLQEAEGDMTCFGTPILLPANRTEDGSFSFRGRTYALPINEAKGNHIHGCLMKRGFEVTEREESMVRCRYVSVPEDYPFPFVLTVAVSLSEYGLKQEFCLENPLPEPFPAVFGLHTTFRAPDWVQLPLRDAWERSARFLPTGKLIPLTDREQAWVRGARFRDEAVSGFYRSSGHAAKIGRFTYRVSELFDQWTLYNGGGGKGYLCVEPQAGRVNGLNHPKGHLLVPGNGSLTFKTEITG